MAGKTAKTVALCAACLLLIQPFLCPLNGQDTGRPKILVLPPVTQVDRKVSEDFQWNLAKVLDRSGNFDIVTQKQYTNFLKSMKLDREPTIPDSVVPLMMDSLRVSIYSEGTLNQPGGKGSELTARVDFIYPKNDFTFEGEELSVPDEKQTMELAEQAAQVIILASEKISYMSIARDYYNSSIYKKAIEYYGKLLELDPGSISAMYMLATSYLKMDSLDIAIEQYENILASVDPEHVPTRDILAKTYFGKEDYENSLRNYRILSGKKPGEYEYTQYEAYCLVKLERPDEALEAFDRLVKIRDEDPGIRTQMGYIYFTKATELEQAGDSASAREQAKLAVGHFQRTVELYRSNDNSDQAGQNTDPAVNKKCCDAMNLCALSYLKAGDIPNAIKTFSELVKVDPEYPNAYYYMTVKANELKRYDATLRYAEEALKYVNDKNLRYSMLSIMGRIYYRQKQDYQKAVDTYTQALLVAPDNRKVIVLLFRGLSYYDMAQKLDYSNNESVDVDELIDQEQMTTQRADQALAFYDKSLADLNKVTGRYAKNAKAHINNIAQLKKRLDKIKQQIDYYQKTK